SPGLSPTEKADITRRCPSHDGLCEATSDADGLAYYPLSSGRWCLAHSCAAGMEHTGRGGHRVFTRAVILAAEDRAAFDFDPMAMLTAMNEAGLTEVELDPPAELSSATLQPGPALCPPGETADCWNQSAAAMTDALDVLLHGQQLVLIAGDDPVNSMWALTASLPISVRASTSISCNLKFSMGRCLSLNIVADEATRLRRLVRGQPVTCIDLNDYQPSSDRQVGPWVEMVAQRWAQGRVSDLIDLTAQASADGSAADFDAIAALFAELETLDKRSSRELVEMIRRLRPGADGCSVGPDISHRIGTRVARRLNDLAASMSPEEAWNTGTELADAYLQAWVARSLLAAPLVACLEKVVTRRPADVARFVVGMLESAVAVDTGILVPLDSSLQELLRRIASSFTPTDLADARAMGKLLRRWHVFLPHHEVAGHLADRFSARSSKRERT
ncbi:MAG: hypothetical protein IH988_05505, partial [Planctomycetes bacterium]|nr:hypothetical protein [Planctomycetota bacterium]